MKDKLSTLLGGVILIMLTCLLFVASIPKGKETVVINSNNPTVVSNWVVGNLRNGFRISNTISFPISIYGDGEKGYGNKVVNGSVIVIMER